MPLIIDTNNVLETTGALPPDLAGPDLSELAGLIASSRFGGEAVTLVCDGPARDEGPLPPGMRAVFAGALRRGLCADRVIARLVTESTDPKRLLVVSSDRAVQGQARRRRCRVMDAPDFLRTLARDHERRSRTAAPPPIPPDAGLPPPNQPFPRSIIRDAEEMLGESGDDPAF